VDWLVTTLIKTPGHAPADTLSSATFLNQMRAPGGVAQVSELLREARRKDPQAQLFPEITATTIGENYLRGGDPQSAVAIFGLVLLAYPDSADAYENLAEAYLRDGRKKPARQAAQKALALLDAHAVPARYRAVPRGGAPRRGNGAEGRTGEMTPAVAGRATATPECGPGSAVALPNVDCGSTVNSRRSAKTGLPVTRNWRP